MLQTVSLPGLWRMLHLFNHFLFYGLNGLFAVAVTGLLLCGKVLLLAVGVRGSVWSVKLCGDCKTVRSHWTNLTWCTGTDSSPLSAVCKLYCKHVLSSGGLETKALQWQKDLFVCVCRTEPGNSLRAEAALICLKQPLCCGLHGPQNTRSTEGSNNIWRGHL